MDIYEELKKKFDICDYYDKSGINNKIINNVLSNILKIENFNIYNYTPEYYIKKNKNIVKFCINKYENKLLFYKFNNYKYKIIINKNKYKLYENEELYNFNYILYKYINISSIYLRFIEIVVSIFNHENDCGGGMDGLDVVNNILFNKLDNKIIKIYYTTYDNINNKTKKTDWGCHYNYYYNYNTKYIQEKYTSKEKDIFLNNFNSKYITKNLVIKLNNNKIKLRKSHKYIENYKYKMYSKYTKNNKFYYYFDYTNNKFYYYFDYKNNFQYKKHDFDYYNNKEYIKNFYKYIKKFNSKIKFLI